MLDTPSEPWTIQLELGLEGRLDEERLRSAVGDAITRHPMARVRQLPARPNDKTWWWEVAPGPDVDPLRVVECPGESSLTAARGELYSRPVPLVEAPPFRLWLVRGQQRDRLLLDATHAAFDGFGCLRLLQSVARAYRGDPDPIPAVDLTEARDVMRLLRAGDAKGRSRRVRLLGSKAIDLVRPPARLADEGGSPAPGYGFHHQVLSEDQTAGLDKESGPTVNELLLAALHLGVQAWNDAHRRETDRVGVLVPVNLRPKEWRQDVVTNFVLDARVLTTSAERTTPQRVLEAVSAQSRQIKEGAGPALIELLKPWSGLPLWAKQPLSPFLSLAGRLVDTAVLSNLSVLREPPDFGEEAGQTIEAFFSAPTRMPCGLSIGAVTVGGRLHLSFRYRHPQFDQAAAGRFADRFVAELERVAGDQPATSRRTSRRG
ncbi:MAG: hypothetical protein M3144_12410 [Actinomycetota bacterium]|nr:hypothetical protein [Actinomycetota bacterium]